MDKKTFNNYAQLYKEELEKGEIQIAYKMLTQYVMQLKAEFEKELSDRFSFGNVSMGYMDFTYFPFFDATLREQKLRYGIVLNHKEMQFELWLMGQNIKIQTEYWNKLKNTKWNSHRSEKPRYSELEVILVTNPDFDNLDILGQNIRDRAMKLGEEINQHI